MLRQVFRGEFAGQTAHFLQADEASLPAAERLQINTHLDDTTRSNDRVSLARSFSFSLSLFRRIFSLNSERNNARMNDTRNRDAIQCDDFPMQLKLATTLDAAAVRNDRELQE